MHTPKASIVNVPERIRSFTPRLNMKRFAVLILFAMSCVASVFAQQSVRMLLHDRRVSTDSVVRRIVAQRAVLIDSSSFFRVVTIGIDTASEAAIRANPWVLSLQP